MGVMGGKRVAELGVLGEHGRCDGGRREVAGRACPAPTGWWKGERVLAGRCAGVGWFRAIPVGGRRPRRAAEGSRPLPTM